MNKKRILLTGGNGMVGRNLLEHPDTQAFEMIVPTRQELDLTKFGAVLDFVTVHRPDCVLHAAGKVGGIQANIREPVSFLLDNIDIGRNVIWAARQAGVKHLINLGSSCMYPRNINTPLKEAQVLSGELEPTNEGYAIAKIVAARLCSYISSEDTDFQYKTLIPCNLYGRHDKFDPANSHLIPAIIHKIYQAKTHAKKSVEIWGDGTARREFMYAGDLADALVRSINEFESLPATMNVGLGSDHSIDEYYHAAAEIIGFSGSFTHNLEKPVGMARKLVSIEKQKVWGWQSSHTLHEGIEKTYAFYLKGISK